ncbi:hypothetical protein ACNHUS_05215 [Actinomycetes bacterium M1A6_2h]
MRRLLIATALLAAGCSQTAALAPVGGEDIGNIRYAALDVLVENQVDILTAPVCAGAGAGIRCVGQTVDERDITVASTAEDAGSMTVTVGGRQLYSGSVQDVLDRNGTGS